MMAVVRMGVAAAVIAAVMQTPTYALGDADRGEAVFRMCASCHAVGESARNKTGPVLNGIVGRAAASVEGARYSLALKAAADEGLVWDEDALSAFLESPRTYLKGTRMSFRGLKDEKDRVDVIAFLSLFSASGEIIEHGAEVEALDLDNVVSPEVLALEGDADYGEYLSGECTTCHRRDGADQGIPSIVNLTEHSFVLAMHAYKTKAREHPVMNMVAGRLANEEIAALAAYFATLEK